MVVNRRLTLFMLYVGMMLDQCSHCLKEVFGSDTGMIRTAVPTLLYVCCLFLNCFVSEVSWKNSFMWFWVSFSLSRFVFIRRQNILI